METISFSLIGHKGRSFDCRLNATESLLVSSNEDSTAKIWDLKSKRAIFTLQHDKSHEVLRASFLSSSNVVTCTSNGEIMIWNCPIDNNKASIVHRLSHESSQIYACETIFENESCVQLLTAADNSLYVWDINNYKLQDKWSFTSEISNGFGGPRNPNNDCFIFDAKPSTISSYMIAVALSDGCIQFLDSRISQYNNKARANISSSHITSVSFLNLFYYSYSRLSDKLELRQFYNFCFIG